MEEVSPALALLEALAAAFCCEQVTYQHLTCAGKRLHEALIDVENGSHVLRLLECHDKNELTAMSLDVSGRRLITGSRAGDIKVHQLCSRQIPVELVAELILATLVTS